MGTFSYGFVVGVGRVCDCGSFIFVVGTRKLKMMGAAPEQPRMPTPEEMALDTKVFTLFHSPLLLFFFFFFFFFCCCCCFRLVCFYFGSDDQSPLTTDSRETFDTFLDYEVTRN